MSRPEVTGPSDETLGRLRYRLQRLHREQGDPSYRELERATGRALSHTTIGKVLKCATVPRWAQLAVVVRALDGDEEEFRRLWVAAKDSADKLPPSDSVIRRPTDEIEHLRGENERLRSRLAAAASTFATRATIVGGRWIVGPPLSGTGFGLTFQATDVNDPTLLVVLKRIRPDNSNPEEPKRALRYLHREQELQARVDSRFVAPLLDAGDDPQFGPYIATPHYKLGTVRQHLRQEGFVPTLGWALRIAAQILAGLVDCIDQASLIHLDIKPTNVALDADGDVKLIDFGLARTLNVLDGPSSVVPAFSLWYAAPEQIRKRLFSHWKTSAADVRAVAAVVYEIVSGEPPLRREAEAAGIDLSDADALINVIELVCDRTTRPERLDRLVPGLPPYVADLIDRWLSHNPADRASGPHKFAVHNAAEELLRIQARVTAERLESVPLGWTEARRLTGTTDDDTADTIFPET